MTDLTELQMLAGDAALMPWEKSKADIPYANRSAFLNAIEPETVLKLIAVARAAQAYIDWTEAVLCTDPELKRIRESMRTALEELAGSPQERREG